MKLGTVVHSLILEPEKVAAEIAVMPKFDKRTTIGKKAAEEFEEDNRGKLVVDEGVFDRARCIADAVSAHPIVQEHMRDGVAETTMIWEQYGVPCKARVDYLKGSGIFDVKTCSDASPEGFARQIAQFQYHVQAAHYANGYREIVGWDLDRFVFVAVESETPYAVGVYTLDARSLQSGRILIERAADAYKRALTMPSAAVPSYADEIVEISVPNWAQVEPFGE
jgi:exodeoxyribonuclease VIII